MAATDYDLPRNAANHAPLSPLSFLSRTEAVYPTRIATIHGSRRITWAETGERCRRLASALARAGIAKGDTVAAMLPNIPEMFEAHFGVPMAGAVLNALNIRLDAATIAFILQHGEAKILLTDREFSATIEAALAQIPEANRPLVIDVVDELAPPGKTVGSTDYETFLTTGDPAYPITLPDDEWDAIALNYTSGTTGNPKGVVYHHRGATLNATSNVLTWGMPPHPVYLWTLPMFHCNGWCFPWTMAAVAGTNICLRRVEPQAVLSAITTHAVTHMCGAPIIATMLINVPDAAFPDFATEAGPRTVEFMTAGAPPPAAVIAGIERRGFHITHVYGLTEVYGPVTVCAWQDEWNALPEPDQAHIKARQGVRYHSLEGLMVADARTLVPMPKDGTTMGEVFMRGNPVMKGYLKNPKATAEAFEGGWFHTGDLGVWHPDGYIELKDRSKDIIISGGENISTIEVEDVLYKHPAIMEAAVVGRPDATWGETPCAFVTLREGASATAEELIEFCRANMARYKVPKTVVFGPLPKTSTGKMQKYVLRERAAALQPPPPS